MLREFFFAGFYGEPGKLVDPVFGIHKGFCTYLLTSHFEFGYDLILEYLQSRLGSNIDAPLKTAALSCYYGWWRREKRSQLVVVGRCSQLRLWVVEEVVVEVDVV